MGRAAGQHAAGRAPVDPCSCRGDRARALGGPVAGAGVGTAVQRVRRRRTRPRRVHRRAATGRPSGPAGPGAAGGAAGDVPRRSPNELPRRGTRSWPTPRFASLRRADRPNRDAMGRRAAADDLDGATAGPRSGRGSARARPSLPPRLRAGHRRGVRRVGRNPAGARVDHVRRVGGLADAGPHAHRRRLDPERGREGAPHVRPTSCGGAAPPQRRHVLPPPGSRSGAARPRSRPAARPLATAGLAGCRSGRG